MAHTARHQHESERTVAVCGPIVSYSLISIKAVSIGTNYCSILTAECGGYSFGLATDNPCVGITRRLSFNHIFFPFFLQTDGFMNG